MSLQTELHANKTCGWHTYLLYFEHTLNAQKFMFSNTKLYFAVEQSFYILLFVFANYNGKCARVVRLTAVKGKSYSD